VNARDTILNQLAGPDEDPESIAREAAMLLIGVERPPLAADTLVEAFLDRLAAPRVSATHDKIVSLADLPGAVSRYLAGRGLRPALYLPPDPVLMALDWRGIDLHENCAPDQEVALAVAIRGVAETGSLVFDTSPTSPMLPNFLCLHHLVLLRRDTIVRWLDQANDPGPQPRGHYLVTGVSGTTDIEGEYVRGAHGPRFLHVILLDDG